MKRCERKTEKGCEVKWKQWRDVKGRQRRDVKYKCRETCDCRRSILSCWNTNDSFIDRGVKFHLRWLSSKLHCSALTKLTLRRTRMIPKSGNKFWPNGLASRRKFSISARLAFRLATHLRWLALTLVELKFVRKSLQVFHRLTAQRKSTQVDRKSTVYAWHLRLFAWTCEPTCESIWPPIASLYASSGFANLRVHLARALIIQKIDDNECLG